MLMHNSTYHSFYSAWKHHQECHPQASQTCVHRPTGNQIHAHTLQPPPSKVVHGDIFVAERFVGWQEGVLLALQSAFNKDTKVGGKAVVDSTIRR